ncbi:MAG: hypothetical protein KJ600_00205 [Nanoarchaeota archaeon]|nr:hypothetical protein [Nanoarchaeota archaeon]MBU1102967.1 hypothetical protein [Nanoarchaeota archaeon]
MKIKNLVLGIGIVVVFALTLWQGIEAFHSSPQWDDFCGERTTTPRPLDKPADQITLPECEQQGGVWQDEYCDFYYECQQEFNHAEDAHSKIVFTISLIAALASIILGYFILSVEPVGSALIASGIWAIFYGSAINWRNFSSIIRFSLLLVALVLLIWLAMRLNKKKK